MDAAYRLGKVPLLSLRAINANGDLWQDDVPQI